MRRKQVISPAMQRWLVEHPSDTARAWVFFSDRGLNDDAKTAAISRVAETISPRALQRRRDRGTLPGPITDYDLPPSSDYVDAVVATGARLRITSKWLNAISVEAGAAQIGAIAEMPFVTGVHPVARSAGVWPADVVPRPQPGALRGAGSFYGAADGQLQQIALQAVHGLGYTGGGIIIGILDTGFQRTHEAFNFPGHAVQVLGEHDFVNNDGVTSIEPGDPETQHRHGTLILGTIGAYNPDVLVGGAYDAAFYLAKTEDITQEVPAEEDQYVAGLEWLEAQGVQMATSSLGYIDWYFQAELDGQTAITTQAVNMATQLGLVCVTAAGNAGHDSDPGTSALIAPSDAFDIIACGAVNSEGTIAGFSSDGPTADGRVKPEVLAQGVFTATVDPGDDLNYVGASGTSLSTPLVACSVAALLQAHPDWSNGRIRTALLRTASDVTANGVPDPTFVRGYGIVNTLAALNYIFAYGDYDGDGDVDLHDFGRYHRCLMGPGVSAQGTCLSFDADGDGDIDLVDFGSFQTAFGG